ncbi:hypothetical protein BK708_37380, partial [Bacillus thuringiensis serovar yunnanensis]
DTQKTKNSPKQEQKHDQGVDQHGLLAHYYEDASFQKVVSITPKQKNNFKIEQNQQTHKALYQAARLRGYIQPDKDGEYTFSASGDKNAIIKIGDTIVLNMGVKQKIKLEKGKPYPITVEFATEGLDTFTLSWSKDGGKEEVIPENTFLLPDFSKDDLNPNENLPQANNTAFQLATLPNQPTKPDQDTDGCGIPDEWKVNGYVAIPDPTTGVINNKTIYPWDFAIDPANHLLTKEADGRYKINGTNQYAQKYTGEPTMRSSTGDPYTDLEKLSWAPGNSGGILPEATSPYVAADAKVGVNMEKMILTPNQSIAQQIGKDEKVDTSKTVTTSTTNSHTDSTTVGASISAGVEGIFPTASVSANFSSDSSNTVSVDNSSSETSGHSSGKSWSETLNLNTSDPAYINANIRYYNAGTAPIYNVKPTINFVVGDGTTETITAKTNTVANEIKPGGTYPEKDQHSVAWKYTDDFNAQPFHVNSEQLKQIENGTPLKIETTQVSGNLPSEKSITGEESGVDSKVTESKDAVESATARIIIDLGSQNEKERRIAARSKDHYNEQKRPEFTVKQAIEMAFPGAKVENNKLVYETLNGANIQVVLDQNTVGQIGQQVKDGKATNFFDAKITAGMNILITQAPAFVHKDGKTFCYDKEGKMLTGFVNIVENGILKTYYFARKGDFQYTPQTVGQMVTDSRTIEGNEYYFDLKDGSAKKGWFQDKTGYWYYYDLGSGIMKGKDGWIKIDGKSYYFNHHGALMKGENTEESYVGNNPTTIGV